MRKLRIGVIFGGQSGEHEVSLVSARSVINAMDPEKYEIVPIGIDREGRWVTGSDPMAYLEAMAEVRLHGFRSTPPDEDVRVGGTLPPDGLLQSLDVVFPVLHGPYGEDGTIQGLLEIAGVPYVGSGVAASAAGMDKALAKMVFQSQRFPILPYESVTLHEWWFDRQAIIQRVSARLTYPVFVKPANLGSSVGISKVEREEELADAVELAARYDQKILIEQGIPAREIECSILGNEEPIASVPGEVKPGKDWYDYEAKYQSKSTQLVIPAPIPDELTRRVQEIAIGAYKAIGCEGLARVDFLLDKSTGEIYLNELNTMPGFTDVSMYPKLWEATGITYRELVDRLIELALERGR